MLGKCALESKGIRILRLFADCIFFLMDGLIWPVGLVVRDPDS